LDPWDPWHVYLLIDSKNINHRIGSVNKNQALPREPTTFIFGGYGAPYIIGFKTFIFPWLVGDPRVPGFLPSPSRGKNSGKTRLRPTQQRGDFPGN